MNKIIFDEETGEIIDHPLCEQFSVTDEDSATWVLGKIFEVDCALEAISLKREKINNNLDKQAAFHARKKDWLILKFGDQLKAYAQEQLKDSSKKSIQLDFGKIGFRHCKRSVKIKDKSGAISFLEENGFDNAVSVKKDVLLSVLPEVEKLPTEFFEIIEAHDKFYIN